MSTEAVISSIKPDSKAERAGLSPGDRILKVNGETVRDLIELSFALSEKRVTLDVAKASGGMVQLRLKKTIDEDLGFEFESAVFDRVRTCANKCLFCFVDQMPEGLRETLYVKDDDYRLSFLYGNFVTLTNLTDADFDRIRRFHLSPLYVSVHTTDGILREKMLGTPRAADIMQQLRKLAAVGIEMHTQIVLCPDWNDGEALHRTVHELAQLQPEVLSVAIVPVGLTRFRESCHPLRLFTESEAAAIVDAVSVWQTEFRKEIGSSFVYLSDEMYLKAGRDIPPEEYYDGYPQLENGIGLIRSFLTEWSVGLASHTATCKASKKNVVVCGTAFAPVLTSLLQPFGAAVRVEAVTNQFFGPAVNVSGLLTGGDIVSHLQSLPEKPGHVVLSSTMLRKQEKVFLDGMTLEEFTQKADAVVHIVAGAAELQSVLTGREE